MILTERGSPVKSGEAFFDDQNFLCPLFEIFNESKEPESNEETLWHPV